jgi:hypothetical protein
LRIRFPYVKAARARPTWHSREFIVFWRDQFGSVNFAAAGDWEGQIDDISSGVCGAYREVSGTDDT